MQVKKLKWFLTFLLIKLLHLLLSLFQVPTLYLINTTFVESSNYQIMLSNKCYFKYLVQLEFIIKYSLVWYYILHIWVSKAGEMQLSFDDVLNWLENLKLRSISRLLMLARQSTVTLSTYTVLHVFRQVLFGAGNQGNHQNFENSCYPINVD